MVSLASARRALSALLLAVAVGLSGGAAPSLAQGGDAGTAGEDPFAEPSGQGGAGQGGGDPFAEPSGQGGAGQGGGDPFAEAFGEGVGEGGGDPFAEAFGEAGAGEAPGGAFGAGVGGVRFLGFAEVERGIHVGPDSVQERDWVLDNIRVRLKTSLTNPDGGAFLKLDFIRDGVVDDSLVDLREARLQYTPLSWLDLSVGRQVNTWGVGDLVFINDLFPKDWVSMFTGRDMEDLKESANSVRATAYLGAVTWDVVYHPDFAPDEVPDGCRFAVFDPNTGGLVARPEACADPPAFPPEGSGQAEDGEVATRLMTDIGAMQAALYAYRGFWKSPRGLMWIDPATGEPVTGRAPDPATDTLRPFHPRLNVYGLSLEGQAGPGILAFEAGYYDSVEDREGTDFLVENSTRKALLGYRMDFSAHFGAGVQWFAEFMDDYEAYEESVRRNDPAGFPFRKAERRDTFTLRLTFKLQQETLFINLFGYNRPQDEDGYYKLDFTKRLDNHFELTAGANVFEGEDGFLDREFGMLRNDDNAFFRLRYNF